MVSGRKPATLFNIEIDDGLRSEAFAFCSFDGCAAIFFSLARGALETVQLLFFATAEKHQETESVLQQQLSLAVPGVGFFARRRTKPKAREGKGLAKERKGVIARINIAVKSKV